MFFRVAAAGWLVGFVFLLLRTVFTVAPIAFGLDKFFGVLTDWEQYLAPWIDSIVPGTAQQAMYAVGVVEVVAGIVVAVAPRFGGWLVAAWQISLGFGIGLPFAYVLALVCLAAAAGSMPSMSKLM